MARLSSRIVQVSGSGGGGITNSAGSGVLMKSDGTNAVASSISDDGSKVTITKQVGIGSAPPVPYRQLQITNTDPTLEEGLWVQCTATGHVGTDANQAINVVLRQSGTSNATATACTATCIDANVTQTKSAGSNALTNTCILANASGGTTNYSFYSSNGQMVQAGDAHFGAADFTSIANTGTLSSGASTLGQTTVTGLLTAGTAGAGQTHVFNGNINVRSSNADTWVNIRNTSTGGREYYIEASGNGGTDPNCLAIYDNTAGATRFRVTSTGQVEALAGLKVTGNVGFYGTTPIAKQTGVAVTAGAIHAALVALGLIAA